MPRAKMCKCVCVYVREREWEKVRERDTHGFSSVLVLQENTRHTPAQMARVPEHHPMYNPSPNSNLQPKKHKTVEHKQPGYN